MLWRWLLVGVALTLIKLVFGLVGYGLYTMQALLALIPLVIGIALALYLVVNQQFFLQITLFEERNLVGTIQRGRNLNDPRWWRMLGFLATLALVNLLLGLLVLYTGFIVAIPLMLCISTAAYLQLREPSAEPTGQAPLGTAAAGIRLLFLGVATTGFRVMRCNRSSRRKEVLTLRSSREWKLMMPNSPSGSNHSGACCNRRSSTPSSSLTAMRSAWKVRVAG